MRLNFRKLFWPWLLRPSPKIGYSGYNKGQPRWPFLFFVMPFKQNFERHAWTWKLWTCPTNIMTRLMRKKHLVFYFSELWHFALFVPALIFRKQSLLISLGIEPKQLQWYLSAFESSQWEKVVDLAGIFSPTRCLGTVGSQVTFHFRWCRIYGT